MRPESAAMIANLRTELAAPGALYVAIRSSDRMVAIFPDDLVGKTDRQLLAFVRERLTQG